MILCGEPAPSPGCDKGLAEGQELEHRRCASHLRSSASGHTRGRTGSRATPDTDFHWISPRTAPAPGAGEEAEGREGWGIRVPPCERQGEGVSPSPNGDSHHGSLHRDRPGEEPDLEPHTDTASHRVSSSTAPAPGGGGGRRRGRGGVAGTALRETGEVPPPRGDSHHGPVYGDKPGDRAGVRPESRPSLYLRPPNAASHRVSSRTAPAPGGGGAPQARAGWGLTGIATR